MTGEHSSTARKPNRLLGATSPYLRQHAYNPVDWRPWNDESLAEARTRDLPIFLSIGYAACHWCHVMERESFENVQIAHFLNGHFVCIKVDREERPDLDHLYMSFTQAMTGAGGWPMTVFLTPSLRPFYTGTYFPPHDLHGRPGFLRLITELSRLWTEVPEQLQASAEEITTILQQHFEPRNGERTLPDDLLSTAAAYWLEQYDLRHGGFGRAPKFPHPVELLLLLRHYQRTGEVGALRAVQHTGIAMLAGGIFDQLGGGFHRYSVDDLWLVPHFEKMLYDNGLLLSVLSAIHAVHAAPEIGEGITRTIQFLTREMRHGSGLFYASIDADSEGEEGKFYRWAYGEFIAAAGESGHALAADFNLTPEGNFEGENILHRTVTRSEQEECAFCNSLPEELAHGFRRAFDVRGRRLRPQTDTKLLTSWNGLILAGFVDAGMVTGEQEYFRQALAIARAVRQELWTDGALAHGLSDDRVIPGELCEDYAYLLFGLTRLLAADSVLLIPNDELQQNYDWAAALATRALACFVDDDGRCYLTPENAADLIMRPHEYHDGALPSPAGMLARSLVRLSRLTGDDNWRAQARRMIEAAAGELRQFSQGMASMVMAADELARPDADVLVVGKFPDDDVHAFRASHWPRGVLVLHDRDGAHPSSGFQQKRTDDAAIFVCAGQVCYPPVKSLAEAESLLSRVASV